MFLVNLLMLLNGVLKNDFLVGVRASVFGLPVNLFDALVTAGLIIPFFISRERRVATRVHPAVKWALGFFAAGAVAGLIAAFLNGMMENRYFFTTFRNYIMLPMSVCVGYFLFNKLKSIKAFITIFVITGIATSIMVILFFKGRGAESTSVTRIDINLLRSMQYGIGFACITFAFLLYTLVTGWRLMPTLVTVLIALLCFLGGTATLSRSDWLALLAAMIAICFLLPPGRRVGQISAIVLSIPLLICFIFFGLFLASKATGVDFQSKMKERLYSMLPTQRETSKEVKAWDSRLSGQLRELELWLESPIIGQGFGMYNIRGAHGEYVGGYGHNSWTYTIYSTGPAGFIGVAIVIFGTFVIGRRMVRDNTDRQTLLLGALAAVSAAFFVLHGAATASWNGQRPAMTVGMMFGVLARARMLQLRQKQLDEWEAHEREQSELAAYDEFLPSYGHEHADSYN